MQQEISQRGSNALPYSKLTRKKGWRFFFVTTSLNACCSWAYHRITECSSSDRSVLFVLGRWLNPFKPPRSLLLYFKELCEHRVKTNVNMQSELSLQHYFYIVCLPTMILRASISVYFCSLGLAIVFLVLVFLVCCSCCGCFSVPIVIISGFLPFQTL